MVKFWGKSSPEFDWEEIKRFRENVGVYAKKEGEQGWHHKKQ